MKHTMKHTLLAGLAALMLALPTAPLHSAEISAVQPIDRETMDKWSAPYRGWHYQPDYVISADPKIPGHEDFKNTDTSQLSPPHGSASTAILRESSISFKKNIPPLADVATGHKS